MTRNRPCARAARRNGISETPCELADATAIQTDIDRLKRNRATAEDKDEKQRIKLEIMEARLYPRLGGVRPRAVEIAGWI